MVSRGSGIFEMHLGHTLTEGWVRWLCRSCTGKQESRSPVKAERSLHLLFLVFLSCYKAALGPQQMWASLLGRPRLQNYGSKQILSFIKYPGSRFCYGTRKFATSVPYLPCLRVSLAMMKHYDSKQLGEERVCYILNF